MLNNTHIQSNETFEEYIKKTSNPLSKPKNKKVGRRKNTGLLTEEQQNKILDYLKEKPIFYSISNEPIWSVKEISYLISKTLDINLPLSTVRDYLNKWFNIQQNQKRNQIKNLFTDDNIFKTAKKDNAIVLYVKSYDYGFINIVTRTNENKFAYIGKDNQKNLLNTFLYIINYYKDSNLYLIFDTVFFNEIFFDKLLYKNSQLKIFYCQNLFISLVLKYKRQPLEYGKDIKKGMSTKNSNFQQLQNKIGEDIIETEDFLHIEDFLPTEDTDFFTSQLSSNEKIDIN